MNNKYPLKQAVITGAMSAIFALGAFSIAEILNHSMGWGLMPTSVRGITGLLTLIILGIGIYTAMRAVKHKNNGAITYKQALLSGMLVAAVTSITMAIFGTLYNTCINPGNTAYMLSETQKLLQAEGKSPAVIAGDLSDLQKQLTTQSQVIQALIGQFVVGTIISLIMGIFVRTKK